MRRLHRSLQEAARSPLRSGAGNQRVSRSECGSRSPSQHARRCSPTAQGSTQTLGRDSRLRSTRPASATAAPAGQSFAAADSRSVPTAPASSATNPDTWRTIRQCRLANGTPLTMGLVVDNGADSTCRSANGAGCASFPRCGSHLDDRAATGLPDSTLGTAGLANTMQELQPGPSPLLMGTPLPARPAAICGAESRRRESLSFLHPSLRPHPWFEPPASHRRSHWKKSAVQDAPLSVNGAQESERHAMIFNAFARSYHDPRL